MPIYDDNHCDELEDAFNVNNRIIKELKRELSDCRDQLKAALRYGFEKNQNIATMEGMIRELRKMVQKGA